MNHHDAMFKMFAASSAPSIAEAQPLATKQASKEKKESDKEKEKEAEKPKDSDPVLTRKEVKEIFKLMVSVDKALRERLFIIQVAIEDGWTTAKDVAFYKAGWLIARSSLEGCIIDSPPFLNS